MNTYEKARRLSQQTSLAGFENLAQEVCVRRITPYQVPARRRAGKAA